MKKNGLRIIEILSYIAAFYHVTEFLLNTLKIYFIMTGLITAIMLYIFAYRDHNSLFRRLVRALWAVLAPPTKRRLVKKLRRKYPHTKFFIATSERSFLGIISRMLVQIIHEKMGANVEKQPIHVGIVCGPMVFKTAQHIIRKRMGAHRNKYADVKFVAMNRAGECDSFQYSANYLATLLSNAFSGSKPVAYTFNEYDRKDIENARRNIDILLCSVGPYPSRKQGYLQKWHEKAKPTLDSSTVLPKECIGDLCLIPIDADGRRIREDSLLNLYFNTIDPFPEFSTLTDLREKSKIILPIDISGKSTNTLLSGKERVAKTLLHSGIVDSCILEKSIAKNLSMAVGDYIIISASKSKPGMPIRACSAYHFAEPFHLRDILILDKQSRIDKICDINNRNRSLPISISAIPQIIISESRAELEQYEFNNESGQIKYRINNNDFEFTIYKGARKPGHFSLVTLQLVCRYVEEIGLNDKGQKVRVLDMGCGSGFIGILTAMLQKDKIEQVICSDIRKEAVACTNTNIKMNQLDGEKKIRAEREFIRVRREK
jgi:hypothetical protein